MNTFCKAISDSGLSFSDIGKMTTMISKAVVSAHKHNVMIDDVITEDNIISVAKNIKKGSNVKSEMIKIINKSEIEDKIKVKIIADMSA